MEENKHLHIISFEIPFPVEHGGMFDLFYKLAALQKQSIKIHLHCFENKRPHQNELKKYCEEVCYYKRKTGILNLFKNLPYIVASRNDKVLTNKLLQDNYPILLEGVQSCFIFRDERFNERKKFVRIHNVEQLYYATLGINERNYAKKKYFLKESALLKNFEKIIAEKATACWVVSDNDFNFYKEKLICKHIRYLPVFIPQWKINCSKGKGNYCLYHGNLSINENEIAAIWLIENVFDDLDFPIVIAGKNPSLKIKSIIKAASNVSLLENPDDNTLNDLIRNAHINLVPSFNTTGIKIKLLNVLFNGRFCIANDAAIAVANLDKVCFVANTADEFKQLINEMLQSSFDETKIQMRKNILLGEFDNEVSAKKVVEWIWEK